MMARAVVDYDNFCNSLVKFQKGKKKLSRNANITQWRKKD